MYGNTLQPFCDLPKLVLAATDTCKLLLQSTACILLSAAFPTQGLLYSTCRPDATSQGCCNQARVIERQNSNCISWVHEDCIGPDLENDSMCLTQPSKAD